MNVEFGRFPMVIDQNSKGPELRNTTLIRLMAPSFKVIISYRRHVGLYLYIVKVAQFIIIS